MAKPLDAERERLLAEGFTENDVREILIRQKVEGASQRAIAPAPTGVMSGVLGNASVAMSHARAAIPVMQDNLANVGDRTAPPKARARSAIILALGAVVVVVLGYAVYQEWQQHIVSATATAAAQVEKVRAEAEAAAGGTTLSGDDYTAGVKRADTARQCVQREIAAAQKRGDYSTDWVQKKCAP